MVRSAAALLGSNLGLALLKFARNIVLARLLSVQDFGTASSFAVIFALVEMTGYLGLDRLLVQDRDGESPRMQAVLQSVQILRGLAISALLFVTAEPLAALMGVPEVGWGFQVMAVMPLLQGLGHLDMARAERAYRFGPFIWVTLGSELAALLAIWPLFLVFGDYRIALYTLVLLQAVRVAMSHAVAARPYRLGWDGAILRRALRFGWPLLVGSLLLFVVFQGDRIIVANRLGPEALGQFSVVFMLTLMAANILVQSVQRLLLPRLSAVQAEPAAFLRLSLVTMELGMLLGLALALGVSILGHDIVRLLFGEKYAAALGLLVWLALMQAVRIVKAGVSVVALARAETRNMFVNNLPRVALLPLTWLALDQGYGLVFVVVAATFGEILGLGLGLWILRAWLLVPLRGLLRPLLGWAAAMLALAADAVLVPPAPGLFAGFHWGQLGLAALAGAACLTMGGLRGWLAARRRGGRAAPAAA